LPLFVNTKENENKIMQEGKRHKQQTRLDVKRLVISNYFNNMTITLILLGNNPTIFAFLLNSLNIEQQIVLALPMYCF